MHWFYRTYIPATCRALLLPRTPPRTLRLLLFFPTPHHTHTLHVLTTTTTHGLLPTTTLLPVYSRLLLRFTFLPAFVASGWFATTFYATRAFTLPFYVPLVRSRSRHHHATAALRLILRIPRSVRLVSSPVYLPPVLTHCHYTHIPYATPPLRLLPPLPYAAFLYRSRAYHRLPLLRYAFTTPYTVPTTHTIPFHTTHYHDYLYLLYPPLPPVLHHAFSYLRLLYVPLRVTDAYLLRSVRDLRSLPLHHATTVTFITIPAVWLLRLLVATFVLLVLYHTFVPPFTGVAVLYLVPHRARATTTFWLFYVRWFITLPVYVSSSTLPYTLHCLAVYLYLHTHTLLHYSSPVPHYVRYVVGLSLFPSSFCVLTFFYVRYGLLVIRSFVKFTTTPPPHRTHGLSSLLRSTAL